MYDRVVNERCIIKLDPVGLRIMIGMLDKFR